MEENTYSRASEIYVNPDLEGYLVEKFKVMRNVKTWCSLQGPTLYLQKNHGGVIQTIDMASEAHSVRKLPDISQFEICLKKGKHVFICSSSTECSEWVEALLKAMALKSNGFGFSVFHGPSSAALDENPYTLPSDDISGQTDAAESVYEDVGEKQGFKTGNPDMGRSKPPPLPPMQSRGGVKMQQQQQEEYTNGYSQSRPTAEYADGCSLSGPAAEYADGCSQSGPTAEYADGCSQSGPTAEYADGCSQSGPTAEYADGCSQSGPTAEYADGCSLSGPTAEYADGCSQSGSTEEYISVQNAASEGLQVPGYSQIYQKEGAELLASSTEIVILRRESSAGARNSLPTTQIENDVETSEASKDQNDSDTGDADDPEFVDAFTELDQALTCPEAPDLELKYYLTESDYQPVTQLHEFLANNNHLLLESSHRHFLVDPEEDPVVNLKMFLQKMQL